MTNTNNFMVHKILPIDNATLFLSRFKYSRSCSEIEFKLWSSSTWIQKKISKMHITMKSPLRDSTPQLLNRKWCFQETADLCRRFSFLWTQFISVPGEQVKIKLALKIPSLLFCFTGKSSKNILGMKLTEGSAEYLQQNFACLPPQHPENSPITNCLEENTFSPIQSALKFVRCDQQSRLFLQTSPTFLKFLISTEAKWSKSSLHWLLEPRSSLPPALCFPALTAQSLPPPLADHPFTHKKLGEKTDTFPQEAGSERGLWFVLHRSISPGWQPQWKGGLVPFRTNSLSITCWALAESIFSYHALPIACNFLWDPVFHLSIFRHLMALNFSGIFPSVTFNSTLILGHQLQY